MKNLCVKLARIFMIFAIFGVFVVATPVVSARNLQTSASVSYTIATITLSAGKTTSSGITPNAQSIGSSCTLYVYARQASSVVMAGHTKVLCNGLVVQIWINSYAEHCSVSTFGYCWGSWDLVTEYNSCYPDYTSSALCPTSGDYYQDVNTGELWRFRGSTCVTFYDTNIVCQGTSVQEQF